MSAKLLLDLLVIAGRHQTLDDELIDAVLPLGPASSGTSEGASPMPLLNEESRRRLGLALAGGGRARHERLDMALLLEDCVTR